MAMNTCRKSARPMLVMLAVAAVVAQSGVSAAVARDHGQRQPSARPQGSYSHQTQVQRTASGHTRSDTWTNAEGHSASRNATVVNDKDAGTRTRDVQRQGPEGQTATRHDETQRTENGYTRNSTATNAQGQTTTRNATGTYDPGTKTWTKDVSVNRGDGG
jgi:hypothetical protein